MDASKQYFFGNSRHIWVVIGIISGMNIRHYFNVCALAHNQTSFEKFDATAGEF